MTRPPLSQDQLDRVRDIRLLANAALVASLDESSTPEQRDAFVAFALGRILRATDGLAPVLEVVA